MTARTTPTPMIHHFTVPSAPSRRLTISLNSGKSLVLSSNVATRSRQSDAISLSVPLAGLAQTSDDPIHLLDRSPLRLEIFRYPRLSPSQQFSQVPYHLNRIFGLERRFIITQAGDFSNAVLAQ